MRSESNKYLGTLKCLDKIPVFLDFGVHVLNLAAGVSKYLEGGTVL